ncbi:hypothetical protein T439DRAFT_332184 [Meredithblackwellia eburnea MCA 4105]
MTDTEDLMKAESLLTDISSTAASSFASFPSFFLFNLLPSPFWYPVIVRCPRPRQPNEASLALALHRATEQERFQVFGVNLAQEGTFHAKTAESRRMDVVGVDQRNQLSQGEVCVWKDAVPSRSAVDMDVESAQVEIDRLHNIIDSLTVRLRYAESLLGVSSIPLLPSTPILMPFESQIPTPPPPLQQLPSPPYQSLECHTEDGGSPLFQPSKAKTLSHSAPSSVTSHHPSFSNLPTHQRSASAGAIPQTSQLVEIPQIKSEPGYDNSQLLYLDDPNAGPAVTGAPFFDMGQQMPRQDLVYPGRWHLEHVNTW